MIDTIKFLIPIDNINDLILLRSTFTQFKKEDLATGQIEFEFYTHNLKLGSFNRSVAIKMSNDPTGLFLEFSVPKYLKGNNVEMIYALDVYDAIEAMYKELQNKIEYQLPHFSKWIIYKLDICYNWYFNTEERAKTAMQFIQRIDYPRKKKYIYDTSVMYKGSAYTIKFYLKGAEFFKNDFKKIEENRALEIYEHAKHILRFEVALKHKYLKDLWGLKELYLKDVLDSEQIIYFLNYYLNDRVFKYVNLTTTTDLNIEEILYNNFNKKKATMLYLFYKNYYFNTGIRSKIINGGFSISSIYRYKKELKRVGVGLDIGDKNCKNVLEELIIPSPTSKFDLNIKY